jgi:hypothetical protein
MQLVFYPRDLDLLCDIKNGTIPPQKMILKILLEKTKACKYNFIRECTLRTLLKNTERLRSDFQQTKEDSQDSIICSVQYGTVLIKTTVN